MSSVSFDDNTCMVLSVLRVLFYCTAAEKNHQTVPAEANLERPFG